jgi:hypothetical protein
MIPKGLIDSLKKLSKETDGREYTDSEAKEAANNLVGFFELLIKVDQRNKQKEHEEGKKFKG